MKLKIVFGIVAICATYTIAQSVSSLPTCAQSCVIENTSGSAIGGCSSTDIKCICSNQDFSSNLSCCLIGACDAADLQSAAAYITQLCASAGVTDLPSSAGCSSNSTDTSSSSSSLESTIASTSSVAVISSSTSSTPTSSSASIASNPTSSSTSSLSNPTSGSASSLSIPTTSNSPTSSDSSTSTSVSSPASSSSAAILAPPKKHNGLSTGAKAGIAIAVVLIAVIGCVLAFFLLRRKKRETTEEDQYPAGAELETKANVHEIKGEGVAPAQHHEVPNKEPFSQYEDVNAPFELYGTDLKPERDKAIEVADNSRKELPASSAMDPAALSPTTPGMSRNPPAAEKYEMMTQANTSELQTGDPQPRNDEGPIPQTYLPFVAETTSSSESTSSPDPVERHLSGSTLSPTSPTLNPSGGSGEPSSSKLNTLRAQHEKIRAERSA